MDLTKLGKNTKILKEIPVFEPVYDNAKLVTKQDIEIIAGRKILDWEYETIVEYIKAFREGKKLIFGRQNNKTRLIDESIVLDGVLPEKVVFK